MGIDMTFNTDKPVCMIFKNVFYMYLYVKNNTGKK